MAKNNRRGRNNNNPEGRNQYDWGVMEMARERPFAAAAAAAGAAAVGLFAWSRRTAISNQLSNLSDQIGEWREGMWSSETEPDDDTAGLTTASKSTMSSTSSRQRGMSETGGGNASLGRRSGGNGIRSNASSRGRAKGIPSTT